MTPNDVAILESLAGLVAKMGALPIMSILLIVVIGPWLMAVFLDRAQERRVKAVADMYTNNVKLVEEGQRLAQRLIKLDEDLQGIIAMNSQAMARLCEVLKARGD